MCGNVFALSQRLAAGMESPSLPCSNDLCRFARFEDRRSMEESSEDRVSVRRKLEQEAVAAQGMSRLRLQSRSSRKQATQAARRVGSRCCRVRPLPSQQEEAMKAMKTLSECLLRCGASAGADTKWDSQAEEHAPGTRPAQTKLRSSAAESLDVDGEENCFSSLDGWRWAGCDGFVGVVATRSKGPLNKEN